MKHAVLSYQFCDGRPTLEEERIRYKAIHNDPQFETSKDRQRSNNQWRWNLMFRSWQGLRDVYKKLDSLRSLTIDLSEVRCPAGCCRRGVVRLLFNGYVEPVNANIAVRISGVRTSEEWQIISGTQARKVFNFFHIVAQKYIDSST